MYKIISTKDGFLVSGHARRADNFYLRLKGLMFRASLDADEALIFYNAPSIHTFFMRFAIDLVFLDKDYRILRIVSFLPAWRMVYGAGSYVTLELSPGRARRCGLAKGDSLQILPS